MRQRKKSQGPRGINIGAWDVNVGGEEIYYKLKETTKRTSMCWNCAKVVDIKLIKECEFCKTANYCSYECAVAHWRWHQKDCRVLTKLRKQKEKTDSFIDIEAVD
eukprot:scaffold90390_cov50-Cyclotella_meneghiniana.AAC.1